jgi:hypothetical protein
MRGIALSPIISASFTFARLRTSARQADSLHTMTFIVEPTRTKYYRRKNVHVEEFSAIDADLIKRS